MTRPCICCQFYNTKTTICEKADDNSYKYVTSKEFLYGERGYCKIYKNLTASQLQNDRSEKDKIFITSYFMGAKNVVR
jgi:hypothetical protein